MRRRHHKGGTQRRLQVVCIPLVCRRCRLGDRRRACHWCSRHWRCRWCCRWRLSRLPAATLPLLALPAAVRHRRKLVPLRLHPRRLLLRRRRRRRARHDPRRAARRLIVVVQQAGAHQENAARRHGGWGWWELYQHCVCSCRDHNCHAPLVADAWTQQHQQQQRSRGEEERRGKGEGEERKREIDFFPRHHRPQTAAMSHVKHVNATTARRQITAGSGVCGLVVNRAVTTVFHHLNLFATFRVYGHPPGGERQREERSR